MHREKENPLGEEIGENNYFRLLLCTFFAHEKRKNVITFCKCDIYGFPYTSARLNNARIKQNV